LAQIEIFEFLKAQREKGIKTYYTPMKIYKLLSENNLYESKHKHRVYAALIQLEAFGYVEVIRKGKIRKFHRAYRVKAKYINKPNS